MMDLDPIELAVARARTERALFGRAEPVLVGRHEVLDTLAGGGMGMVYRGIDRDLQRKVALKVLLPDRRTDPRARERLTREAKALAQLDHPNVVKIHDVIDHHGQLVIVMELVDGTTLDRWLAMAPRTWREVVHVYAQAADGLAAAHAQGFVHRDFKPTNAIIGVDGRVRVLDFGLAQAASSVERTVVEGAVAPPDLTTTGDMVGTLTFAAPEQLAGDEVTAASDQFSFCAALHSAIEGLPAFAGRDIAARLASIRTGEIRRARGSRPAWLRAVISRGLAATPAERFPTMAALVAELRRPRGWPRWRSPVLATGLAGAAFGAALVVRPPAATTCDDGAARVASVWNAGVRTHLGALIRSTGAPDATEISQRAVASLDAYQVSWQQAHHDACVARDQHASTAPRQLACLTQHLRDLRAAVAVLETTGHGETANVLEVVANLPRLRDCALDHVGTRLPESPALQLAVAAVRSQIGVAAAAARAGRTARATEALTTAVRAADATRYRPLRIEAGLALGRVSLSVSDHARARQALTRVRALAMAADDKEAAVEAAARLLYVEALTRPDRGRLEHDLDFVLPMTEQLPEDSVARPLLLNNIGAAYLAAGDREQAFAYFARAKAILGAKAPPVPELIGVYRNLAMLTPDPRAREALLRRVCEYLRDELGPQHPFTIEALVAYGMYAAAPSVAFEQLSLACAAYRRYHPDEKDLLAFAEFRRASLAAELGMNAAAIASYRAAIGLWQDDSLLQRLSEGELAILEGAADRARRALTSALAMTVNSTVWWERVEHMRATVRLGEAALLRGDEALATRYLETAVAGYAHHVALNEDVELPRMRARAERLLAGLLARTGHDTARANTLSQDAQSFYRAASPTDYARWLPETR